MKISKDSVQSSSSGMGFLGWLTLLFIALKLTGYIAWSWVWVLAPVWIPICILLGFLLVFVILYLINGR